jgi:hypothetical protein
MAGFVSSIETTENVSYENVHDKQKHFLICESCFWCASSLSTLDPHLINHETIPKCPLCTSNRIRVMPIFKRFVSLNIVKNINNTNIKF